MKFKKNIAILSKREQEAYNLPEEFSCIDNRISRVISSGTYEIEINGLKVKFTVNLELVDEHNGFIVFYKATGNIGEFGDISYEVTKPRPIRKFDIFREVIKYYQELKFLELKNEGE